MKVLKWAAVAIAVSLTTVLAVRAWDSQRGPPLELWHTYVPHEMTAAATSKADWGQYLAAEDRVFTEVREEVTDKLPPESRTAYNRYFSGSPIYPGQVHAGLESFVRARSRRRARRRGGALSRADRYAVQRPRRSHGAMPTRALSRSRSGCPGHGTVPSGLAHVEWEQWVEASRLAVREAQRRAGPSAPLHLVGYSNGGALAMKYALDALDDSALPRPTRIVLISPMIGITSMARFAGVAGWPAVFPAFAKAAWLDVTPEFNPFKYNSFPVNAARQSSLISRALQNQIAAHAKDGRLAELPPILTFQSVVDFTVSTRAIVDALYGNLPANGSELVLFDLNRSARFGPLFRASADTMLSRLLPDPPRAFRTTIITNAGPDDAEVVSRTVEAGATTEQVRTLGLTYPRDVYSLSHIALPFAMDDRLYGLQPASAEDYGVNLGALAMRGER